VERREARSPEGACGQWTRVLESKMPFQKAGPTTTGSVAVLGLRFDGLAFTSIPTTGPQSRSRWLQNGRWLKGDWQLDWHPA